MNLVAWERCRPLLHCLWWAVLALAGTPACWGAQSATVATEGADNAKALASTNAPAMSPLGFPLGLMTGKDLGQSATDNPNARSLNPGEAISVAVVDGEPHTFSIRLGARQYTRVTVEQHGIDLTLDVSGPGGRVAARTNNPNGHGSRESVSILSDEGGAYVLTVSPTERGVAAGRFVISAEPPRSPAEDDGRRISAEMAMSEGEALRRQGKKEDLEAAVTKYREALQGWRSLGDRDEEANALLRIGNALRTLRMPHEAEQNYDAVVGLRMKLSDLYGEAAARVEMCFAFIGNGDPRKPLEQCGRARDIFASLGDQLGIARALVYTGYVYLSVGDTRKALETFAPALDLARRAGDRSREAVLLSNMASAQDILGERYAALENYELAAVIWKRLGSEDRLGAALNGIAVIYDGFGEWQEALRVYAEAAKLWRRPDQRGRRATLLGNMGMLYAAMGDTRSALAHLQEASAIQREMGDARGQGTVLYNIGFAHAVAGDLSRAREYYLQSLTFQEKASDLRGKAYTLTALGSAQAEGGEVEASLKSYEQALAVWERADDPLGRAYTLRKLGALQLQAGDLRGAASHLEQSLSICRKSADRSGEADTLFGMAALAERRGEFSAALAHMEGALSVVEGLRAKGSIDRLRTSYLARRQNFYDLAIRLRMRLHAAEPSAGHAAAALRLSEAARARGLLDILHGAGVLVSREAADPLSGLLLARRDALQLELDAKAEHKQSLLAGGRAGEADAVGRELDLLIAELDEVRARIKARARARDVPASSAPLGASEIQERVVVEGGTVLLEYALGEERSYLWAVTREAVNSYVLPGRAEIEARVAKVKRLLTMRQPVPGETNAERRRRLIEAPAADALYWKEAVALSRILLGPASGELSRAGRVIFVPDGELLYLPFGALPMPAKVGAGNEGATLHDAAGRSPLIVRHEVITLPSASTLAVLREKAGRRRPAPRAVAVLADPVYEAEDSRLKNRTVPSAGVAPVRDAGGQSRNQATTFGRLLSSREEANAIRGLAPAGVRLVATDFDANRALAAGDALSQYRIVHFAAHGVLDDQQPELSGVVLSLYDREGRRQDGFLRLKDIYDLGLKADLVVLSACNTALGKRVGGEGFVGLTRGFMSAGATRVVSSLWQADDEATAELMRHFYDGMLKKGMSPAAALRAAQLELLRQPSRGAPFYWAAFILQGEW